MIVDGCCVLFIQISASMQHKLQIQLLLSKELKILVLQDQHWLIEYWQHWKSEIF
jgi:hypothetical protein